jgi:hypothetical protein
MLTILYACESAMKVTVLDP